MPNLETVNGVKMNVYAAEHLPPHFHAEYNENEVLLVISDGSIFKGWLPAAQLRTAKDWLTENRANVLNVFYQLNPNLKENARKKNKIQPKGAKNK